MLIIYNLFIFFSLNIFLVNILYITEKKNISIIEFYTLFIWHFLFSLIYFYYVSIIGGDTNGFVEYAKNYTVNDEKLRSLAIANGSSLLYNMLYFFHNHLRLDILNIISIFNFIGFIGLIYFFMTLKDIVKKIDIDNFLIKNLPYLIIFIPSLSFWTSGIGKEPLVFLSISLFVYTLNKQKCNYFILFMAFIILFQVRWQFSIIMLLSVLLNFKASEIPKYLKNIKFLALIIVGFVIINLLTAYFKDFHVFKLDWLLNSIYQNQKFTIGSQIVNFDVNFFQLILNYLFTPINFENIFFSITSMENIYIIFLIFILIINFNKNNLHSMNLAFLSFIILFLSTIPFATFNIGIAIRQKWTVLIIIFVFLASFLKTYEKK